MVKILDCTTRDGGYLTNWSYTKDYILNLIYELNRLNIDMYEIGYRNHYDIEGKGEFYTSNTKLLKAFYKNKQNLKLGVMTDAKRFDELDFKEKKYDYIDFVRIACHPDCIKKALTITENISKKGYNVFLHLMDISRVEEKEFEILNNWKNKDILESIYFADTYGEIEKEDVKKYYTKLQDTGYKNISFHAHNKSGRAYENTFTAINMGAYSIDVTHNGVGRNGGNLDRKLILK